jgi:transcriptional regulator NrdR family protein
MRVKRKNGNEEEFIREKIVVAIVKAGGNTEGARRIAQEVESSLATSPTITTEQIRTEVLNRLKERDAKAYQGWLDYETQNRRA